MKLSKLLLTGVLAVLPLGLTAVAARAEDLLDSVKQAGVLKIGLEGTYPPFDYRNSDGQLEGFDVDVAKAIAARLGVKPEFVPTEWSGIIAALQAGKFDVIVNQVTITPQRQQALDFSQPYTYSAAQLIQRADDKREFKSLEEFKGDLDEYAAWLRARGSNGGGEAEPKKAKDKEKEKPAATAGKVPDYTPRDKKKNKDR